jgi:ACS family sodium-dependent inorganic phosphate cotransporter
VAAIGIVICYADRSNMSTAILPMAETYNWDKVRPSSSSSTSNM